MTDIVQDIIDEVYKITEKEGPPLHHRLAGYLFERGEITEEQHKEMKTSVLKWVDKELGGSD